MSFTGFPSFEVLVGLVAGLFATVGAMVALGLVVGVVQGALAAAGRLAGSGSGAAEIGGHRARMVGPTRGDTGVGREPRHAVVGRQAGWRLRC